MQQAGDLSGRIRDDCLAVCEDWRPIGALVPPQEARVVAAYVLSLSATDAMAHQPALDTEEIVILAAARLGETRLIDNVTLNFNPSADWGMLAAH